MRALLIDDEQLILDSLEALLMAGLPDLTLDKTTDVDAATDLAASVKYGFVVLDWHLVGPRREAIDARGVVEALRKAASTAPIIVVSGDYELDWPRILLELGLSGFVPKGVGGTVLHDAVQVALRGGIYLPSRHLLQAIQGPYRRVAEGRAPIDPRERYPDLTGRQAEVFTVMMSGVSDKQIARTLGIAESTVKTHVGEILSKLGVGRRSEAISRAMATTNGQHA